jgi:hypothetical protein
MNITEHYKMQILSTASTRVLMNGSVGERLCHARGLRQHDPLSLMIFFYTQATIH